MDMYSEPIAAPRHASVSIAIRISADSIVGIGSKNYWVCGCANGIDKSEIRPQFRPGAKFHYYSWFNRQLNPFPQSKSIVNDIWTAQFIPNGVSGQIS